MKESLARLRNYQIFCWTNHKIQIFLLPGAYSLPNSGRPINSAEGGSYPSGYVPISNTPSTVAPAHAQVVAKLQGSWQGGVPPNQDGGMYGGFDGYPPTEQGAYPPNIYQQY